MHESLVVHKVLRVAPAALEVNDLVLEIRIGFPKGTDILLNIVLVMQHLVSELLVVRRRTHVRGLQIVTCAIEVLLHLCQRLCNGCRPAYLRPP